MDDSALTSSPPPTRAGLLQWGEDRLSRADRDAPHRSAAWLLMDVLGCARTDLYLNGDAAVAGEAAAAFRDGIERCAGGEPLQHVLGHTDFYGLRVQVTPDVLIPRPETEEVVEHALSLLEETAAPVVLDVGTGSGCIACAIAHARPDATVLACDVSPEALSVAASNARRLNLDVTFAQADVLADDFPRCVREAFGTDAVDLLLSNPPYVPDGEAASLSKTVREFEPALALFTGDDPTRFYRALARHATQLCRPGGRLVAEIHADFGPDVQAAFQKAGLTDVEVKTDLSNRPRIAVGTRPRATAGQP